MDFLCPLQLSPVWSHWGWSQGRFPQSRSAPPPSTTPTGPLNARASTTRRTAGRPPTILSGSGYRSVQVTHVGLSFYWDGNHAAPLLISESELTISSFAWRRSSNWTVLLRTCSHLVWILFTHLYIFPARSRDTEGKKEPTCIIYWSASPAQLTFLIFIVKSDIAADSVWK